MPCRTFANGIKNVFNTKLKLNSPLSESDRRGFQLQFCWTHICHDSLRAGVRGQEGGQVGPPRPSGDDAAEQADVTRNGSVLDPCAALENYSESKLGGDAGGLWEALETLLR